MTRLIEKDIAYLTEGLDALDEASRVMTGKDIEELAREAAGYVGKGAGVVTAVVPITAGLGLIGNFSESCRAILSHCGAQVFVSEHTDVAGIQEAYRRGAQLIFTADDDICTMLATNKTVYSDNGDATGRSFAVALDHMMQNRSKRTFGHLSDRTNDTYNQPMHRDDQQGASVLVLGAGPVGVAALRYFHEKGIEAFVFDLDGEKGKCAAEHTGTHACTDSACIHQFRNILDATSTGDFMHAGDVDDKTIISAPGMPLCVDQEAAQIVTLYHNPLELGVAAMYFDCLRQIEDTRL
ncbi:MAG: hypothetical protein LKF61_04285 [Eggerthellaceae bacterium]|jgi:pyrrolysine biosynthesis protein PylD|nr:hypothetical protein [Eggerthellaceae bacterium]MCH4221659.1 hypothetical protein [Eggerthellaceae bacterium]